MLKKLAKYGNSTTLVIDKAILELLNMNESSIVKLHTDGKSLIITPVEQDDKKISQELQPVFNQIFQKHKPILQNFQFEILPSIEFQTELSLLTERIDPLSQPEEYYKEFNLLKLRFCPELEGYQKEIEKEIEEASKKYTSVP